MGEVFLILREMMFDAVPVMVYMIVSAMACGVAFEVLIPRAARDVTVSLNPFNAGLWAVLGDFEFLSVIDASASPLRSQFNWLPGLLYRRSGPNPGHSGVLRKTSDCVSRATDGLLAPSRRSSSSIS